MKRKLLVLYVLVAFVLVCNNVYATVVTDLSLSTNKESITQGEEVIVTVNLKNMSSAIASIEGYINIDENILDSISSNMVVTNDEGKIEVKTNGTVSNSLSYAFNPSASNADFDVIFNTNSNATDGNDVFFVMDLKNDISANTDILQLKFRAKTNATVGDVRNAVTLDDVVTYSAATGDKSNYLSASTNIKIVSNDNPPNDANLRAPALNMREDWSNTAVKFTITDTQNNSNDIEKYQYRIGNGNWQDVSLNTEVTALDRTGTAIVTVRAVGKGNGSYSPSVSKTAKVDLEKPTVSISEDTGKIIVNASDSNSGIKETKYAFSFENDENRNGTWTTLDSSKEAKYTGDKDTTRDIYLHVLSVDNVDNQTLITKSYKNPQQATIESQNSFSNTKPRYKIKDETNQSGTYIYQVKINDGTWQNANLNTDYTINNPIQGRNTIKVRTVDILGRTSSETSYTTTYSSGNGGVSSLNTNTNNTNTNTNRNTNTNTTNTNRNTNTYNNTNRNTNTNTNRNSNTNTKTNTNRNTNSSKSNNVNDNTLASNKLPQSGLKTVITPLLVFMVLALISYKKYMDYKEV